MSVVERVSSTGCITPGIVSVGDLQRHERSPNMMGVNFTYRSVFDFEKGLGSEVLVFDPEATAPTPGADAAPLVDDGTVDDFTGDDTDDFTEAAARCMAARPLVLVVRA
jgi:hypothetical protein